MSPTNHFDLFDPTGMLKPLRDAQLEAWSKAMVEFVNSEAYAKANGEALQAWLTGAGPAIKAMESAMKQTLANLCLPSRDEITRLAQRLTNIEMRLDSLDAKLDECLRPATKPAAGVASPSQENQA